MTKRKPAHATRHVSEVTIRSADRLRESDELLLRERVQRLEHEKLALEEQLRRLQYVKSVSEMVMAVSHDLTGALTGILWCTEALKRRAAEFDPDLRAGVDELVSAAEYARRLARNVMSANAQKPGRFVRCLIAPAVTEAAKLLNVLRPRDVTLSVTADAEDAEIWGCPEELQQIVVNLGANSFDAVLPSGGHVHISLAKTSEHVVLRVSDTGHGMSPEVLRRATDPHFTTKGASGGNGLGLVVVKTIIDRHAGQFSLSSAEGKGTTAEVVFPVLPAS